jgi:hypothetical protein
MIKRFLEWALSLFGPSKKEQIEAWPFPAVSEDFEPRPKKKPTVKKATTRTKKPAVAAKTARTKKAK